MFSFHIENIMDISRILTFSSLQTLRSNSWISGWVAGGIERNRRRKRDRDRWYPSRSPRRTPLFRKRDLTFQELRPWTTEVIGSERSSRLSAIIPPSLLHFGERRQSIRTVESRVRSLAGDGDIGWRQPDSAVETTDFRISTRHIDGREYCVSS